MDFKKVKPLRPHALAYFIILFSHFCKNFFADLRNSVLKNK